MGEMRCLNQTGDLKVVWNTDNKDEIAAAREQFDKLRAKRFQAYSVKGSEKNKKIDKFDPEAGMIIMVPEIGGG